MDERRKALEEQFFRQENAKHIEKLRAEQQVTDAKKSLAEASGIDNDELLQVLVGTGISADTLVAVSLVPLIEVAWADGEVQEAEQTAIIKAAEIEGVHAGSNAHAMFSDWLTHKPAPTLMAVWKTYVTDLLGELSESQRRAFVDQMIRRATAVAQAAGGFLGLSAISGDEERVLSEIRTILGAS